MIENPHPSKTQYFIKNFYWMLVNLLVTSLFPFLVRSLMIRKWGLEYVGISGLFTSIVQVLNISELGMGSAILYSMYKPMAEHDIPRVNALLNLYRKIYRNLGIGIFIVGMSVMPFLQFLIYGDYPADVNIHIVYFIQLLNTVSGYIIGYYWVVILQADQKVSIDCKIGAVTAGVMYILQLFVICNSHNYYLYIILFPLTTLTLNSSRAFYIQQKYPHIHCEGDVDRSYMKDFSRRVFAMALSKIRTAIRNSIDSIVVSAGMGLVALAQYQNYYQVMLIPMLLVEVAKKAFLPEFGVSVATESKEKNYYFFEIYSFASNWFTTWCAVCLLCLGQNFICLWVGADNVLSDSVIILMCIYFYVGSISNNAAMIREATGVWWVGKEGAVIESVLNFFLNILFVRYWGIQGVLIATILTLVCINLPYEYLSIFNGYFEISIMKYFVKQILYFVNGIFICFVTYKVCGKFPRGDFKAMIAEAVICILLPNILFIALNFYRKEFKQLLDILYYSLVRRT